MKFSKLTYVVMACLIVGSSNCFAKTEPIYNVEHHATIATEKLTNKQIRTRISDAAASRGWSCKDSGKNSMVCEIDVRQRHQAKIEIQYERDNFSIHNIDSTNLLFKNGKIHRNYNRWIKKLEASIVRAFMVSNNAKQ